MFVGCVAFNSKCVNKQKQIFTMVFLRSQSEAINCMLGIYLANDGLKLFLFRPLSAFNTVAKSFRIFVLVTLKMSAYIDIHFSIQLYTVLMVLHFKVVDPNIPKCHEQRKSQSWKDRWKFQRRQYSNDGGTFSSPFTFYGVNLDVHTQTHHRLYGLALALYWISIRE